MYWKRLRTVITFLLIWIGVPIGFSIWFSIPGLAATIIVTWLPAFLISEYLNV